MNLLEEVKVPQDSVNDDYLTVVKVNFSEGDKVQANDTIIELETSKTVFTIEANTEGYIYYLCKPGDEVAVNSVIVKIFDQALLSEEQSSDIHDQVLINNSSLNHLPVNSTLFSKRALALIEKHNLDKASFAGKDLINEKDIEKYLYPDKVVNNRRQADVKKSESGKTQKLPEGIKLEAVTPAKLREISYLKQVQEDDLVSTLHTYIDTEGLFDFVNPYLQYFKNSLLPVITYECARLLNHFPELNAFFTNNSLAYFENVNIGVAMDLESKGLMVATIRKTDTCDLREIENIIFDLSCKYLDGKLAPSDVIDVTFTITDLSSEGVTHFQPLINKNNSAILGIGKLDEKLDRIPLSLAFDHRVTGGRRAGEFLKELTKRVESYKNAQLIAYAYGEKSHKAVKCWRCLKSLDEDISGIGLLPIVKPTGEQAFICQTCLLGH